MAWALFDRTKTYENPNWYNWYNWLVPDLRKSISPNVGLESHLDSFTVEGNIRREDRDLTLTYRIECDKKPTLGWMFHITADTPELKSEVLERMKGIVGGGERDLGGKVYLSPSGNPSTTEVVSAVETYAAAMEEVVIAKVRFTGVKKGTYEKAKKAKLLLQPTK